jgi:alkylation response protein AidB-like acyl-CoA dehydrogenase
VPDAQRLGAVGAGWKVALTTLMNERLTVGTETGLAGADALLRSVHELGYLDDSSVVEQLADAWIVDEGLRLHRCRTLTALARGAQPGPEQSIGKLLKASLSQRIARLALDLRGVEGLVAESDATSPWAALQRTWSWSAAMRIAGGTDQILRNVIAERVLGLPEEFRPDKGLPFKEVPR